nr:hypothetical protein [Tanacetum cinerariifolium]
RARIAQSFTLLTVADEPASPVRDVSEGEACLTESGFIADQDKATIAKSSTLPHDLASMEKVFAIAALKNDLRKSKGNSVATKFAETSTLGKPVLQPLRNKSVVRQLNAFKHERPQMSKQQFASQVDVNHNVSKPVTQHSLPKKSESAFAKPDHMIASGSSRNNSKNMPRFNSNDMVHNHYLDEDKKKTRERDRNSRPSMMTLARFQSTTADSKPKPRSTNHSSISLPMSKSSCVMITAMPKAAHSKSPSSFSDPTRFFCSKCHKCVFNANHDACITKLLKEVNSRAKIQPHKTRDSNKPIDQKSHTKTPGRHIFTGHKFSSNKNFAVYKKTSPRSDLRNQCQSGFTDDEIKMASAHNSFDPAPTCQTMASVQISSDPVPKCQTMALEHNSLSPGRNCQENISHTDKTSTTSNELDLLFSPMFDELFNGS